jgi:hypothetical protein
MSKQEFCVNAMVAKVLKDYVQQPDYSEKRAEIANHEFASLKVHTANDKWNGSVWCKILFTTSDAVIVQEVEMTCNKTRFQVYKIEYPEWDEKFVEWLDDDWVVRDCWQKGARMYGAWS